MKKAIFITSSGTDMGKTYISALLVKAIRKQGINCGYFKPALSGANYSKKGKLIPGDAAYCCQTTGIKEKPEDLVSYMFEPAVSPHLAAKQEGIKINPDKILGDFNRISQAYEYIIVEGCGGLTCPLIDFNQRSPYLVADLVSEMGLNAMTIIPSGLGGIHAALSSEAFAKEKDINNIGFICNRWKETDLLHQDNIQMIEKIIKKPVYLKVPNNCIELCLSDDFMKLLFL